MTEITNRKIFIVEDEQQLLDELVEKFSPQNSVMGATTFLQAKEVLKSFAPDIVLLDVLLPDGNGTDLMEFLKENTPVIILSDLGGEDNIVSGFKKGACDYMVKPYSLKVLEERMKLRLLPKDEAVIFKSGLKLNTHTRMVFFGDEQVNLTTNEFDILYFLMKNAGKFFTSDEIYENVWNLASLNNGTVRYHMHNLRKKLTAVSPLCAQLIITKFGGGYSFVEDASD